LEGAKNCLFYILSFRILNPNEKDISNNTPLFYLLANHSDETPNNKEMFLRLSRYSDITVAGNTGIPLYKLFCDWQVDVYKKFIKKTNLFDKKETIEI
jgi:hypothetical protein